MVLPRSAVQGRQRQYDLFQASGGSLSDCPGRPGKRRLLPAARSESSQRLIRRRLMPIATQATSVPVVVDNDKCIADKGCTVCIDVCPLDVLWIDAKTGKAHMRYDECWYCMPCETDC